MQNTQNTQNTLKVTAGAVAIIATVDVFGFIAWAASSQVPADSFYIGSITAHVLRALFF